MLWVQSFSPEETVARHNFSCLRISPENPRIFWLPTLVSSRWTKQIIIVFYATCEYILTSFSRRSPSASAVTSRSYWDCNPIQNSEDVPKNRASLRAVSAVIFLFSRTISFILRAGTPIFRAGLFWLKPNYSGIKNLARSVIKNFIVCRYVMISRLPYFMFPQGRFSEVWRAIFFRSIHG